MSQKRKYKKKKNKYPRSNTLCGVNGQLKNIFFTFKKVDAKLT